MLLKLIKTQSFPTGTYCELWEINHVFGNRHLANVFVLNEHLPLELIYRLTVSWRGICLQGHYCGWQWTVPMELMVTEYLRGVLRSHEDIYIEVCQPEPNLPGYPYVNYHPSDFYDCDRAVGLEAAAEVIDE